MNQRDAKLSIPDVQSTPDTRRLAIDRVGVKAIRHPVRIMERDGGVQHTVATFIRRSTAAIVCRVASIHRRHCI